MVHVSVSWLGEKSREEGEEGEGEGVRGRRGDNRGRGAHSIFMSSNIYVLSLVRIYVFFVMRFDA